MATKTVKVERQAINADSRTNSGKVTRQRIKEVKPGCFTMDGKRMRLNTFPNVGDIIYTSECKAKWEVLEIY